MADEQAGPRATPDRGTATAELAVAMPAVVVALTAILAVGQATIAQVQCVDAARAGARAAARGDATSVVADLAREGAAAVVTVHRQDGLVTVSVSRRVRLLLARGPVVTVRARASAQAEQQSGSASVLLLGIALVALLLAGAAGSLGSAVIARHQAQSAADLGALAAADVVLGRAPGMPCAAAAQVIRANRAAPTGCVVTGRDVVVGATVRPPGGVALLGAAVARSRAGPGGPGP